MNFRPLLIFSLSVVLIALIGHYISAGLPWGIDDGVKRLMARSFVQSGGISVLIPATSSGEFSADFFPLPKPFAERDGDAFKGIFPALWPVLGGILYAIFGPFGFYLLPAAAFLALVCSLTVLLRKHGDAKTQFWALLITASTLLFYGLTFWEHGLALLLLVPLFSALMSKDYPRRKWALAGFAFGAAIYLRPETALLIPCILILPQSAFKNKFNKLARLAAGVAAALLCVTLLEQLIAGRWAPPQVQFNLNLALGNFNLTERLESVISFLFSSPLPDHLFGIGLLLATLLALMLKNDLIMAIGWPLLSITSLFWAFAKGSVYGITASSQGLFFALPWIVLSLLKVKGERRLKNPLFIMGWGYIALASLLGPDQPGMHWGPRFLFPALIPLLLFTSRVLGKMPARSSRWLMFVSGLGALLFAAGSVLSLAQRGQAGGEVLREVKRMDAQVLVLDRWHAGADLEPLWGEQNLAWVQGPGDLEELLIKLQDRRMGDFGWLQLDDNYDLKEYPLQIQGQRSLPNFAGWNGRLLDISLAETTDPRWGQIYWHAGLRRAEKEELSSALSFLKKAVAALPENANLRYDLAVCLGKMGLISEAIEELREALRIDPRHKAARELLRQLVRALQRDVTRSPLNSLQ